MCGIPLYTEPGQADGRAPGLLAGPRLGLPCTAAPGWRLRLLTWSETPWVSTRCSPRPQLPRGGAHTHVRMCGTERAGGTWEPGLSSCRDASVQHGIPNSTQLSPSPQIPPKKTQTHLTFFDAPNDDFKRRGSRFLPDKCHPFKVCSASNQHNSSAAIMGTQETASPYSTKTTPRSRRTLCLPAMALFFTVPRALASGLSGEPRRAGSPAPVEESTLECQIAL